MAIRDWLRRDARADVGNRVGDVLQKLAAGTKVDAQRTAAVVAAAGFYHRALAALVPSVADPRVTRAYLGQIGRELCLLGASYRLIEDRRLVTAVDVAEGSNPEGDLFYKLNIKHPGRDADSEEQVPEDRVVAIVVLGMGIRGAVAHDASVRTHRGTRVEGRANPLAAAANAEGHEGRFRRSRRRSRGVCEAA